MLEDGGLRVVASKRIRMTREQAEGFYGVHRERPFFNDLVAFMTSGPVVVQVLEGDNAVLRNREIMGATNPANADEGTIRKVHAESIEANSVHGSDSDDNASDRDRLFLQAGRDRRLNRLVTPDLIRVHLFSAIKQEGGCRIKSGMTIRELLSARGNIRRARPDRGGAPPPAPARRGFRDRRAAGS